jgi:hypothetical protein
VPWVKKQHVDEALRLEGYDDTHTVSIAVHHSLRYHEQLLLPVAPDDAHDMLAAVHSAARHAHSLRVGATFDCAPPAEGEPLCSCCWHAELVGGARTKGRAGHDVDILVWHHHEPSCVNGKPPHPLRRALLQTLWSGLVPCWRGLASCRAWLELNFDL